jgi:hypothetical protein
MAEFGEQRIYGGAKAENDLSAKRFFFVEISGADQVDLCDAAADRPFGVLQNKPVAGRAAQVCYAGVTKLRAAGETITAGNLVSTDTAGLATTTIASGGVVRGQAITTATSGALFKCWLFNGMFGTI